MRQWQRWGLAALGVPALGALLWTAAGRRAPAPPLEAPAALGAPVPAVAAPDAIAFQEPQALEGVLSVSFLDTPLAARPRIGPTWHRGRGVPASVDAERVRVASLPGSNRAVPEPARLLYWGVLAILGGAGRRRAARADY